MLTKIAGLGKQKLIAIGVGILALIIILILLITDQLSSTVKYDGQYPVSVKSRKGGSLEITLDGSLTPGIPWEYETPEEENPVITYSVKTSGDDITFDVTPSKTGYGTIKVTKRRTINEIDFPVAEVYLEIVVSEKSYGLQADFVTKSEKAIDGELGADDSEQPYYLTGNCIYLPADGDWRLVEASTLERPKQYVSVGISDNGSRYYRVDYLPEEQQLDLILKSESLGQEIKFKALYNDNNQIILEKAE